jgi:predicted nucleic acid-binding protein
MGHLVDSAVWVSLYLSFDPLHDKAIKLYENLPPQQVFTTPRVVEETTTVLAYKGSLEIALKFIKFIESGEVEIITMNHTELLNFYTQSNKKISTIDASLLYLAKERQLQLHTFDKQLLSIYND